MSKTTKNAKHLVNANVFNIASKVKKFQKQLQKWDGPEKAAKFLHETFGK